MESEERIPDGELGILRLEYENSCIFVFNCKYCSIALYQHIFLPPQGHERTLHVGFLLTIC
jgi:hypothetical protein